MIEVKLPIKRFHPRFAEMNNITFFCWTLVTLCEPFSRIEMIASGELVGTGISILDESNGVTRATFIWNVELTPPILNRLSQWKLFHRVFVWNHDFTMRSAVKNMQKRVHNANA